MPDLARNPKQFGNLIRRARKQRGLSQAKLGEKAGLRQATISLIETGNPAATLETILTVLGVLDLEFQIAPRSKGTAADIGSQPSACATGRTAKQSPGRSSPEGDKRSHRLSIQPGLVGMATRPTGLTLSPFA